MADALPWMLNWPKDKLENSKFYQRMIRQAGRQNEASAGRGDDYYFASQKMADFFAGEFAKRGYAYIKVHYVEALTKKIAKWLIPRLTDQYLCAQSRNPMDMILQGLSSIFLHASQQ